jgi:hypothetical protein
VPTGEITDMAAGRIAPNVTADMTTPVTTDVTTGMTAAVTADMTAVMSANVITLVTAVAGDRRERDEHERQGDRHEFHVHLSRLSIPESLHSTVLVIALRQRRQRRKLTADNRC